VDGVNYLCPRCRGIMTCVSTASIPPIISYQCYSCGYVSKSVKISPSSMTLPQWLWNDDKERMDE